MIFGACYGPVRSDVQNRGFPYQPTNSWRNEKKISGEGCLVHYLALGSATHSGNLVIVTYLV